jgi:hypothetical protein
MFGLNKGGELHADFQRAETPLVFDAEEQVANAGILVFATRQEILGWCRRHYVPPMPKRMGESDISFF